MTTLNPDISHSARHNMVASQVRTNKVWDMEIVDVLEGIARENFVPASHKALAYIDEDIALGNGRIVMEPMITARLIQELNISSNDVVVEIATGMGFASAVMSKLAKTVIAVESDAEMVEQTQARLIESGCENVVVMQADVSVGVGEPASADIIFVNGAIQAEPTALLSLLAEGGRLACIKMDDNGRSQAMLYLRYGDSFSSRPLFDANVPLLPEFAVQKGFEF